MLEDSTSHRGIHYPLTGPQDSFGCAGQQDQTFYDNTEALAFFFFCVGARTAVGESAYCLSTNQGGGSKKGQVAKKASPLRKILDEACQLLNVLGAWNMKFVHWG